MATLLHEREQLEDACRYFAEAFDKYGDCVSDMDVNLYLELLISLEDFKQALEVGLETS